jgi:hypothetical protein
MAYLIKLKLLTRRQCWVPSVRGWTVLAALLLGSVVVVIRSVNPFLSPNSPVSADVLIVESWLPDYALLRAVDEFKRSAYKYVLTTGGRLPEAGNLSRYRTGAEFAAAKLEELGLQSSYVVSVPSPYAARDRTYSSALALKRWLENANVSVRSVNVYSLGAHARRSRLLFRRALGAKVNVGVIACEDIYYDPNRWWGSSEGMRTVFCETLAYLYCLLSFRS